MSQVVVRSGKNALPSCADDRRQTFVFVRKKRRRERPETNNFLPFALKRLTNPPHFIILIYADFRGVAQMVARMVRDHEVVGSNPVTPTKK